MAIPTERCVSRLKNRETLNEFCTVDEISVLYGKDFWVRKQLLAVATIVSALLLTSCTQAGQRSTADAATGTASATAVNVNSAAESLGGSTEGGVGGATGESETSTETS